MKSSSERSTADIYAELLQSLRDKSCKIEETPLWRSLDALTKRELIAFIRSRKRPRPAAPAASRATKSSLGVKISEWIKVKRKTDPDPLLRKAQHIILVFADFHEATIESAVTALDSALDAIKSVLNKLPSRTIALESLVSLVPEQATAYLRWKEFKLEAAENQGEKEASNKAKVARAKARLETCPCERFERRLAFLNEQAKDLDEDAYLAYSSLRNCGFLAVSNGKFRKWLELEKECSIDKESLELLSFIAFDYIATLAELAKSYISRKADDVDGEEISSRNSEFPLLESDCMDRAVEELHIRKLIIQ